MATTDEGAWWRGTRALVLSAVVLWLAVGLILPLVAAHFGTGLILGFPVETFLVLVAVPIALGVMLVSLLQRQAALDRRHGVDEG
jgi:putative solute:sodium symporter small subunit